MLQIIQTIFSLITLVLVGIEYFTHTEAVHPYFMLSFAITISLQAIQSYIREKKGMMVLYSVVALFFFYLSIRQLAGLS